MSGSSIGPMGSRSAVNRTGASQDAASAERPAGPAEQLPKGKPPGRLSGFVKSVTTAFSRLTGAQVAPRGIMFTGVSAAALNEVRRQQRDPQGAAARAPMDAPNSSAKPVRQRLVSTGSAQSASKPPRDELDDLLDQLDAGPSSPAASKQPGAAASLAAGPAPDWDDLIADLMDPTGSEPIPQPSERSRQIDREIDADKAEMSARSAAKAQTQAQPKRTLSIGGHRMEPPEPPKTADDLQHEAAERAFATEMLAPEPDAAAAGPARQDALLARAVDEREATAHSTLDVLNRPAS